MTNPVGESLSLTGPDIRVSGDDELARALSRRRRSGWRGLFEWSATSAPVALLLATGLALGPRGINLLAPGALSLLEPVVAVALAALGVLVGLSVGGGRTYSRRALTAALFHPIITVLLVAGGFVATSFLPPLTLGEPLILLALVAGICAATALTLPTGNPLEPRPPETRVREIGVLIPIIAGGVVLAWARAGSPIGAVLLALQGAGVTFALATAAWLVLSRTASETEERVFAVSALLLVGGAADVLMLSALLAGLFAGAFWRYAARRPRDTISRDVLFVQHPLVVVVLLVAGARTDPSAESLAFGAIYLGLRSAGQFMAGRTASRVARADVPPDLWRYLVPPGVFGVAFALNAATVLPDASVLLGAVVFGTIGSEVIAAFSSPRRAVE